MSKIITKTALSLHPSLTNLPEMTELIRFRFTKLSLGITFPLVFALSAMAQDTSSLADPSTASSPADEPAAGAQKSKLSEKALVRYSGVVQFVEGNAERTDTSQVRSELAHKSVIYEGDAFTVAKGSTLKLVTRNECVAVIYGEARGTALNMEKPWSIKSEALRWICPPGVKDSLVIRGARFEIDGGELFLSGRKLLIIRGKVSTPAGELPTMKILQPQSGKWRADESQTDIYDVWSFNRTRKAPQESFKIAQPPEPIVEAKRTRWIVGPSFGNSGLGADTEGVSRGKVEGDGGHFLNQWRRGKGSFITLIRTMEFKDPSRQQFSGPNQGPPPSSITANAKLFTVEFGYRFNHERWWSPFVRAGGGHSSMTVNINKYDSGFNYGSESTYDFGVVNLSAGIDAYYSPRFLNWFGLYASAELDYTQSFYRSARRNVRENSSTIAKPPEAGEAWRMSLLGSEFMVGLMLLF